MSFFISRLYIRGLSSVKKDDIPFFSTQKPTQSTTEPHKSEFNSRHPGNFILEPYSLLRLKDYKGCLKSIKSYKDCTLSEDDEAFYILIKAVIRNREDRIEKEKAKMFSICYRTANWAMALLTLHLLIYHYKETKQNDHLVEIYEQQTMLYNHQMPDAWNV